MCKKWLAGVGMGLVLVFAAGCGGDSGSADPVSGTYTGTWQGTACDRGLTMVLVQSGTSLSGTYALTNPDFSESITGIVPDQTPPAPATLNGSGGRSFQITFGSYFEMNGGFYKDGVLTCEVSAQK